MSATDSRLPPGELIRLAECVLEPIRFPGSVQPHGAFLAARGDDLRITHVSDNLGTLLGIDPTGVLGRPLAEILGDRVVAELSDILDPATPTSNPSRTSFDDLSVDVVAHRTGEFVMIDLEPLDPAFVDQTATIRAAFRRLSLSTTIPELWANTAIELRRITGYDRVMVYHFHADGHGEVVAEQVIDGLEPYLGLHYPASDIPAQARELYLRKLSRVIASSSEASAALLADANALQSAELDMSDAELRSVSPHHLQFMRNMGQAATFSLSLIRGGELVGMITCAHQTPRRLPFATREALEILANQVSLQLGSMIEIQVLEEKNRVRELRTTLMAQIAADSITGGLFDHQVDVLDLIPADGAAISIRGEVFSVGAVPDPQQLTDFVAALGHHRHRLTFASNALPAEHPELAPMLSPFVGVLLCAFGNDGDFIAWFRGEVARTVDWLGDMSLENRLTPLSPRNSFSAWSEEVTGTSLPWDGADLEAAELCRDLDSVLLHRAESELAELALRDSLTGLPNRRALMDRLEVAIERHARGGDLAVLFIDLDGFKQLNDTQGHSTGDEALRFVGDTLTAVVRAGDTVARLGGDEFVVLCDDTALDEASQVAARILAALDETDSERGWHVAASIGIALASDQASTTKSASVLLSAADAAMYRAKLAGGAQVSS